MKMLFAATPAPGHINPLLTIATMAKARGHEVILTTASAFRSNVEAAGVRFVALAPAADFDLREIPKLFPERTSLTPGPDMMRFDYERIFIDTMLPQAQTLTGIMAAERPDVIIADNYFCGTTPLFLGTAARPPILNIGVTFLPPAWVCRRRKMRKIDASIKHLPKYLMPLSHAPFKPTQIRRSRQRVFPLWLCHSMRVECGWPMRMSSRRYRRLNTTLVLCQSTCTSSVHYRRQGMR